jgi:predicted dehydrogenase
MERRQFLKDMTAGAGLTAALNTAPAALAQKSPNDTIGVACIGLGTRFTELVQNIQACPNVEIRVMSDLYKMNVARARTLIKNPNVREVHEWEKAVADKDVDAVVIATPDFWHAPMLIGAANAKKDVYGEKGWARTLKEAKLMRSAIKENQRIMQLGHQYNSLPQLVKAKEIYKSGQLGKVPLIRSYIDRTNSYPEWQFYGAYNLNVLPKEATRENIDWDRFLANATKRPFDPERFFRWRCWWEYGNGIAGDLMSHIWDCTNGVMGLGIPEAALVMGNQYFWKTDRDVPDQWHVMFDYPKQEVAYTFECVFHSRHVGEMVQFLGRDKTLEVSSSFCRTYLNEWDPANRAKVAELQKRAGTQESNPPDYVMQRNELQVPSHMQNFFDCVRSRQQPVCGVDRAFQEAVAIAMSVEAYRQGRKVRWDPVKEVIV